jgi:hypothetical protein
MKLKFEVVDIVNETTETVLAGLGVLAAWENEHGEPALPKIQAGYVAPIIECALIAYNRKHGKSLSAEDFDKRFEVDGVDVGGEKDKNPSPPATAPQ